MPLVVEQSSPSPFGKSLLQTGKTEQDEFLKVTLGDVSDDDLGAPHPGFDLEVLPHVARGQTLDHSGVALVCVAGINLKIVVLVQHCKKRE